MEKGVTVCVIAYDLQFAFSLHSVLDEWDPRVRFHLCRFEQEAIQYLKGVGVYGNREEYPLPDILFLDAHHPENADLFVLSWIRCRPEFDRVPCVVLNAEAGDRFGQKAMDLGANACVLLEKDKKALVEILDGIKELSGLRMDSMAERESNLHLQT